MLLQTCYLCNNEEKIFPIFLQEVTTTMFGGYICIYIRLSVKIIISKRSFENYAFIFIETPQDPRRKCLL